MKRFFISQTFPDTVSSTGLLVARILVGVALMIHGWPKAQNPTGWADQMGVPHALQALSALAEFGGGLAILIGLLVPLAALGVFINMAYAKFTVHAHDPLVRTGGASWEAAGLYAMFAIIFFTVGPGRFSLDYALSRMMHRSHHPRPTTPHPV
jgi:putative oxidoreductase